MALGRLGATALILALAGCGGITAGAPEEGAKAGLGCVYDSRHCSDQRAAALKALVSDPSRKWVREPAGPEAYASGVRLYAFKQKKKDLTCDELAIGRREAEAAPSVLRGPVATQSLTPAQISRGVMFSADVARELGTEHKRRCKA